jgi:hypothetical protein
VFIVQYSCQLLIRFHPHLISTVKSKYAVGSAMVICSCLVDGASNVTSGTERDPYVINTRHVRNRC